VEYYVAKKKKGSHAGQMQNTHLLRYRTLLMAPVSCIFVPLMCAFGFTPVPNVSLGTLSAFQVLCSSTETWGNFPRAVIRLLQALGAVIFRGQAF
jgi:hypothetical protein